MRWRRGIVSVDDYGLWRLPQAVDEFIQNRQLAIRMERVDETRVVSEELSGRLAAAGLRCSRRRRGRRGAEEFEPGAAFTEEEDAEAVAATGKR